MEVADAVLVEAGNGICMIDVGGGHVGLSEMKCSQGLWNVFATWVEKGLVAETQI